MDKSETYIKMCEKSEEILRHWKPDCGDYVRISERDKRVVIITDHLAFYFADKPLHRFVGVVFPESYSVNSDYKHIIDMVRMILEFDEFIHPEHYCLHGDREPGMFHQGFCEICYTKRNDLVKQFSSMEQLWLAFVMQAKFSKVWSTDKNEWVDVVK